MARSKLKKIAVLTSGGDSSGMNPAVRAVVRSGIYYGMEVFGIMRGYQGLIDNDIIEMGPRSVSNIISRGGTILKTARCKAFMTKTGRKKAIANLERHGIEGIVIIGGDGSFRGASDLCRECGVKVVGVPGTIDNDIAGTEYTIGYDTAVNVAMDAIDKIRDTAASHERVFFVEVMGRHAGYIALEAGVASGAEGVLIPESPTDIEGLAKKLQTGNENGKTSSIVVVAEGDEAGGAFEIAEKVKKLVDLPTRVSILGHLQRGGTPTAVERVSASRLGAAAVKELAKGNGKVMVGIVNGKIKTSPLVKTARRKVAVKELLDLNRMLSI